MKAKCKELLEKGLEWVKQNRKKTIGIAVLFLLIVLFIILMIGMPKYLSKNGESKSESREPSVVTISDELVKELTESAESETSGSTASSEPVKPTVSVQEPVTEKKTAKEAPEVQEEKTTVSDNAEASDGDKPVTDNVVKPTPDTQSSAEQRVTTSEPTPIPVHVHSWTPVQVTIHHDAVTHTVHHDAVYQTVHHDAVTEERPVYEDRTLCNTCGADITQQIMDHIGIVCDGAYHNEYVQTGTNVVVVQAAYDEQVVAQAAYDETVVDQAAYDDVVTTGYKCSSCGATK